MIYTRAKNSLAARISRLEGERRDAVRRGRLRVPGAWEEAGEVDQELRHLKARLHDALKPKRRVG